MVLPSDHLVKKPLFGFLTLFLTLLSLQVIPNFFAPADHAFFILMLLTAVSISSLYLVVYNQRELITGLLMAVPVVLLSWWEGLFTEKIQIVTASAFYILFLIFITRHLLRYLFESSNVSLDMIYAGVCLYLVMGLIWGFVYVVLEVFQPGSFTTSSLDTTALDNPIQLLGKYLYFSYVTLSTLGYGDITPVTRLARSWATIEAILGQFYLVVVVARLVSLYTVSNKNT